jgi:hypothetical protein
MEKVTKEDAPLTTLHMRQLSKLRSLLNRESDLEATLVVDTLPKLLPHIDLTRLDKQPRMAVMGKLGAVLHQQNIYVFHTTLVQLQKLLEAAEIEATSDLRPLLKRTLSHNMSLIKLLFGFLVKSESFKDKKIKVEQPQLFMKHYKPLQELFPFL